MIAFDAQSVPPVACTWLLRWFTNSLDLRYRLDEKHITARVIDSGYAERSRDWPARTLSQIVQFRRTSDGELVAEAHCFLQPDDALAASGMPDPKLVIIDDQEWQIRHDDVDPEDCLACDEWQPRARQSRQEEIARRGRWHRRWPMTR